MSRRSPWRPPISRPSIGAMRSVRSISTRRCTSGLSRRATSASAPCGWIESRFTELRKAARGAMRPEAPRPFAPPPRSRFQAASLLSPIYLT